MATTLNVPSAVIGTAIPLPAYVNARVFAATTAEDFTVPANIDFIIMSGTVPFYICTTTTAAAPASDVTDGTASLYIPSSAQFKVAQADVISIVPTAAGVVTIACYTR